MPSKECVKQFESQGKQCRVSLVQHHLALNNILLAHPDCPHVKHGLRTLNLFHSDFSELREGAFELVPQLEPLTDEEVDYFNSFLGGPGGGGKGDGP